MKNLLFINGHLNTGGCERSLVDLLNNIDYSKYNVDLLLLEEQGDYLAELSENVNICYYPINDAYGPFFKVVLNSVKRRDWFSLKFRLISLLSRKSGNVVLKRLKRLFPKLKPEYDAAIAYRPGICTDLVAYTFDADCKISWWHHGEFNYSEDSKRKLFESYKRMDKICVVSNACINMLTEIEKSISEKLVLIPNMLCVDDMILKSKESAVQKAKQFTITSVGRLSEEKNMIFCPLIAKQLKNEGVDFLWQIIGDGNELRSIQMCIQQNDLEDCVNLLGSKANPYPYIANSDLFVHTSRVESQGIAVLEAMAFSVPVVVAESLGPKEFINGTNGIITECSVNAMSSAIIDLIKDKTKYDKLKGNTKLPEQFLPENVMNLFYATIEG